MKRPPSDRAPDEGPWELRSDLSVTRTLLWVAGASRRGEPKPEVHLYLYDRYWRLAEHCDRRGNRKKAARLFAKADPGGSKRAGQRGT